MAGYFIRVLTGIINLPQIIRTLNAYQAFTDARLAGKADREALEALEELRPILAGKADSRAVEELAATTAATTQDILRQISDHRLNILDQQRRILPLLEEVRRCFPEPLSHEQIKSLLKEEDHILDAMYVAFEDRFRGTREDIKERLRVYLTYVKQAKIGEGSSPIVDIGCGRGEWLEILKEKGYVAKGVEINRVMLDGCRERSLDVVEADAIEYLGSQKANSFGAITGFHLIEHLSLKDLISLFDESLRVLKPRGMIIFETPNPENLIVGAYTFHSDPTHQFLLVPESLNFIAQQRGFINTNILRLHKYSDFNPTDQAAADDFKNKWFYSEMDFALIGYKP